ncbi:MAG: UvrD-helicase domain-containing protein [Chloroherpetonaceae bacterium]|nr:UvrD-helicase domain-containing protein [Chloroherpetonaceae bacterium]
MEHLLQELNPAQRKAVETTDGPVIIIAGAGSGKTRVITYRTAYLIGVRQVAPPQILALTFTNRAANEMKERIRTLLGETATQGLWIGTFHSNFARLLRQHAPALGFSTNFSIYDTEDTQRLIKEIMGELGISLQMLSPQQVQARISAAKNRFVLPHEYLEKSTRFDFFEEHIARIYTRYSERLQRNNALDFDDLLIKPIELFLQKPALLEHYQQRFRYLMIDEYQDTNRAQYLVSKMLAAQHRNICVVGDDAQSIYSWRGADISNILDFERDYPDATVVRLEENYRSTQVILDAANSVIRHNRHQLEKQLFTRNPRGELISLLVSENERHEADKVAQAIRQLKLTRGVANKDIAVFYRTNAQSRVLEDALRANGIPYQVFGSVSFYKRKEIKDVVSYLRFLLNERDEESLLRIINFPARGIGESSVQKLRDIAQAEHLSLYEVICRAPFWTDLPARLLTALSDFRMLIESLRETAAAQNAFETVSELYQKTRLLELLKEEGTAEANTRYDNLQEFLSLARIFSEQSEDNSLRAFLQNIALVSELEEKDDSDNKVSLMTIHMAKGLEFPIVFITGLEEKLFPLSSDELRDLEEERRLFYVAITRAQQKLYISYAKSRYRFGAPQPSLKSRFIDELDGDLVQTEGGHLLSELRAAEKERTRIQRDEYSQLDESDFAAPAPFRPKSEKSKLSSPSVSSMPQLSVGMKVQHKMFGVGKVIALQGSGEDAKVKVFFRTAGEKTLVVKFANLTVLN